MTPVSNDIEAVYALLQEAYQMEHGDQQIALAEEAVRLADLTKDLETQFEARMQLVEAGVFGGADDKSFVAFSWCLAQRDRHPELGNEFEMLWRYKWILNSIGAFPQISKAQIEQMFEDMERRFRQGGAGPRAVYQHRAKVYRLFGEKQKSHEFFQKWKAEKRDFYADCAACEADSEIEHWIFMDNPEEALKKSQVILNGGLSCGEVPHLTYAMILQPLVETKQYADAARYHEKGYPMISRNKDFLGAVAEHILFLVLADEWNKALRLFENHLDWALKVKTDLPKFYFYRAAYLLFLVLGSYGRTSGRLRLPRDFSGFQESGEYQLNELIAFTENELNRISGAFDRRNENNYYSQLYKNTPFLKKYRFKLS